MSAAERNEDQSQGEQGGEDNAHRGSAVDVSEAADPLREDGGENTHDGGSEEHGEAGAGAGDEERRLPIRGGRRG